MPRQGVKLLTSVRSRALLPSLRTVPRGLASLDGGGPGPPDEPLVSRSHEISFTAASIPKEFAPMVDVDGSEGKMFYADSGVSDRHTTTVPLMLIPGSAQTIMSWGPHVKALSKWRRVIIPEYRCQGLITSLKPEFSSMSQLVKDTDALVQHLQLPQLDLAGFSLGGRIAMAYAASPDSRARRVSLTGVPLIRPPLGRAIMRSWAEGLEAEELVASCWSFLINGYSTKFLQANYPHLSKFVAAVVKANDVQRLKLLFRFSMAEKPDDIHSVSSCTTRVQCPVQVIGGSEDRLCDIQSIIALHESVAQSSLGVMADTGHLAPFEQPALWRQQLLSFLDT